MLVLGAMNGIWVVILIVQSTSYFFWNIVKIENILKVLIIEKQEEMVALAHDSSVRTGIKESRIFNMSELFGVDVSSYQGKINWRKAKADGVQFAILKIIRKDLNPDTQFENNWNGCKAAGVEIQGVYNYSYATTITKAITDARKVISTLNGRKAFVWLDVEDSCQKGLGTTLIDIIETYQFEIEKAGLSFGVYTGASFYNTYIKKYGTLTCPLWIAAYGTNDGKQHAIKKPTMSNCIGWQYSSKGVVDGISGYCDVNVFTGGMSGILLKNAPSVALPTIKKGSKGTQALVLQKDLNYLGYKDTSNKKLSEDGIFGDKSCEALARFQMANNLKTDKIYGKNSYNKMCELIK